MRRIPDRADEWARAMPLTRAALVAAVLLAIPMQLAHADGADADVAAVAAVVRDFRAALAAGDSQTVSRLLAPDATVLESGARESREQYLEHHLQADIEFARAVPARYGTMDVRVSGEVAWAISTSVMQGMYESKAVDLVGAELMVLSKTPAGWVIRSIHWSSRESKYGD